MSEAETVQSSLDDFLTRWEASGAAERANYQLFLSELCDVLGVPRPEPSRPDDAENAYVFERAVTFQNGDGTTSTGRIDLYKRACFVLEAKQGSEKAPEGNGDALSMVPKKPRKKGTAVRGTAKWDEAMLAARGQADQYVRALPASEPNPPLIIVVDVGHSIELYADFSRQGRAYVPFPDPLSHRIKLRDLGREEIRDRLRLAWTDPMALDPSRRAAKVTREVAAKLAALAKSLEASGHGAEAVAQFLMRCLFTFFAEDAGLLPVGCFTDLLQSLKKRGEVALFPEMARSLWETMKTGGFSPVIRSQVLRFNGGLYEGVEALALTEEQLDLLIEAGRRDWREVEPAIFGTLLERALDPIERHKLGAHYTPRAYVERLVMPTIIEPLRDEWDAVKAAAVALANEDKLPEARKEVTAFLDKLCHTTILDPACGTGNFLYVSLDHMKRLEGEIRDTLRVFGGEQAAFEGFGQTVDPHQLRGIEINPRAAAIADLVLWIGYLQWHFRTFAKRMPAEPIIRAYHNIECRDALLTYDRVEPVTDEHGRPVTRWDGRTMKPHPVTGEDVPDESARVPMLRYANPGKAEWPEADYVVGNPPFIGDKTMREALGHSYVETLRETYKEISESSDYVIYWWDHAARATKDGRTRRFGFVSTNSIRQTFNRRAIQRHIESGQLSIIYAIPDHPWVDEEECADVRIAMTVAELGDWTGTLQFVTREGRAEEVLELELATKKGKIYSDLTVGANVAGAEALKANEALCCPGVKLFGTGFIVTPEQAESLGLGKVKGLEKHIFPFRNGRDITQSVRNVMVIDLFGLEENQVKAMYPEVYQWLLDHVKPERDHNNRATYRKRWWIFGEPRATFRKALKGLDRYIVTPETAKHRFFLFLEQSILAEGTLIVIASDDAYTHGVLSSRIHVIWSLATGGRLGVGNDPRYNKTRCFDTFPFPDVSDNDRDHIRELAESLDAHRKHQQAQHPDLTLTGMYNVLARLRAGEPLSDREKVIHEHGLVSVLKQIHDDLDAAVFDAYGWPPDLSDDDILRRLVDLNRERAAEEARGHVRWLRPEFQAPDSARAATQGRLPIAPGETPEPPRAPTPPKKKQPWPKTLPERVKAVRSSLSSYPSGITPAQLARTFQRGNPDRIAELLDALVSLGQARALDDGRYVAA